MTEKRDGSEENPTGNPRKSSAGTRRKKEKRDITREEK